MTAQDTENQTGGADTTGTTTNPQPAAGVTDSSGTAAAGDASNAGASEGTTDPKSEGTASVEGTASSTSSDTNQAAASSSTNTGTSAAEPETSHYAFKHLETFVAAKFSELALDFKKGEAAVKADVEALLRTLAEKIDSDAEKAKQSA